MTQFAWIMSRFWFLIEFPGVIKKTAEVSNVTHRKTHSTITHLQS